MLTILPPFLWAHIRHLLVDTATSRQALVQRQVKLEYHITARRPLQEADTAMVETDTGQHSAFPDPVVDAAVSESQNSDLPRTPKVQVVAPEPLPAFVFPALSPARDLSAVDSSTGPLLSHELPPWVRSNLHSRRRSVTPLPSFNFHPGQIGPSEDKISPKTPDTSSKTPPPRSGGHRRGGSEFIGGDGIPAGLGLMSASPTKGAGALPLPRSHPSPGKSDGRRGHAHRRSGAISFHDLSDISRPSAVGVSSRPESAPTSPVVTNVFASLESVEDKSLNDGGESGLTPRQSLGSWPLRRSEGGIPRARVGFSDYVEYIPRALSPLSSESSSSQATIRGIESNAGSMSSIISGSSNNGDLVKSENMSEQEAFGHGPTSPGPVPIRRGSVGGRPFGGMSSTFGWPNPVPSSNLSASSKGVGSSEDDVFHPVDESPSGSFLWSTSRDPAKETIARANGRSPFDPGLSTARGSGLNAPLSGNLVASLRPKKDRKVAKGPERTSRWTGSIMSRRSRHKQRLIVRRTLTPPPQTLSPREGSPDIDFDNDNTTVIVSPTFRYSIPLQSPHGQGSLSPITNPTTPVIDLDAPMDNAQTGLRSKDGPKTGFEGARRRMHSSGITGGFRGPGMDYHRRTESAPELTDSEFGRASLHRLRNSMASVFEEEEEDEEDVKRVVGGAEKPEHKPRETAGMGIDAVDSFKPNDVKELGWKDGDPLSNKDDGGENQEIVQIKNKTFAEQEVTGKERSVSAVVGAARQVKRDSGAVVMDQRSQSWPSAKPSEAIAESAAEIVRRDSTTVSIGLGLSNQYQDRITAETSSLTISSSASPELATSTFDQPSVQTPSVFTSNTSITDERMLPSWSMGEPSPDMRISTDDLPSLASDNASAVYSYASPASRPYSNDGGAPGFTVRSGSMTSYATSASGLANSRPTTAKRSSLVSLSKLVGGSRVEKSKLSIEEKPQSESPDKTGKEKKTKRFGRLMSFLKTKQGR